MAGNKMLAFPWNIFCRNVLAQPYTRSENCVGEFKKEDKEIAILSCAYNGLAVF